MKSTNEYIKLLRQYMNTHAAHYGITRMGIFGSVARGEQTNDSDIDICFEAPAPNLLTLVHIKYELEDLFGCPVDLIRMRDRMDEYLRRDIEKEALYV